MSSNQDDNDIDFSEWVLDVDGAQLDNGGYYRCSDCGDVLDATDERVPDRDHTTIFWECPSCQNKYPISAADARPKRL